MNERKKERKKENGGGKQCPSKDLNQNYWSLNGLQDKKSKTMAESRTC